MMKMLFFTAEQWPTYRADVATLFGKYLHRHNINIDLVTAENAKSAENIGWPAGRLFLKKLPSSRAAQYVSKFFHQIKVLITTNFQEYDAVQVRDMTLIAAFVLLKARLTSKPFYYWLSFPHSEDQMARAKRRGMKAGMRFWFPLIQGTIGHFLLYRIILPNSNHVFVQSQNMLEAVERNGINQNKMTPIPMGVDLELSNIEIKPFFLDEFYDRRVVVYLGTLDPLREIDILLEMTKVIKDKCPNILLLLVGDTTDIEYKAWLKEKARSLGIDDNIYWTGWIPMEEAWRYVKSAEIGLSPIPRNNILDMGSPTKAVEYMALEIPAVVNDNPDQATIVRESKSGICVSLTANNFAEAVLSLLNDEGLRLEMARNGKAYISQVRGYHQIAAKLARIYISNQSMSKGK